MTATANGDWQIWVDTGGTFTDCLALGPDGGLRRAKVLSSGILRATVTEQVSPNALHIDAPWREDAPDNLPSGFLVRTTAGGDALGTVTAFASSARILTLDVPLSPIPVGTTLELVSGWEAPLLAAHLVTRTPSNQPLPPLSLRLATTRGTNALLTRTGTPPALFITAGFADLLQIGTQQRPDLFALDIRKPEALYGPVIEVAERLAADGSVLRPLEEEQLRTAAVQLVASGVTTAAVALLHAYRNPVHEERVAALLQDVGFTHVSTSAALAPFIKLLPRAQTAVVNAYLAPVIDAYLGGVSGALPADATLHVMTSAGGVVRGDRFSPRDSLLSGPAGGILGAAKAGLQAGYARLIAFDMGGTSTDVSRIEGNPETGRMDLNYVFEHTVGDAHLVAPALAIESVAAGGGSICAVDTHGRVRVGPASAGASPGPACYGAGGPLTITDVNLLLGRLDPERFEIPLDIEAARRRAEELVSALEQRTGTPTTDPDILLAGFLDIADEAMAQAIRKVSVRQGYAPSDHALLAFGGAGGQHACGVASRLGVRTVLIPPDASLLSAAGLGHAAIERFAERQPFLRLDAPHALSQVAALIAELEAEASRAVVAESVAQEQVAIRRRIALLRFVGQETSLEVEYSATLPLSEAFANRYEAVYGHRPEASRPVEVESLRVSASYSPPPRPLLIKEGEPEPAHDSAKEAEELHDSFSPSLIRRGRGGGEKAAFFDGVWLPTTLHNRDTLAQGDTFEGPALVVERHSVTVVPPGWSGKVDSVGTLVLTTSAAPPDAPRSTSQGEPQGTAEPVALELFTRRFEAVAEEMGQMLQRMALSVNVKERLDFSCALLGPEGDLVASAAHIPVHLGALGACVRRMREAVVMDSGETWVTNHPAFGGSHLPDVTVVTPVHLPENGQLLGYVASRAHHAEIGGTRPGSMPPDARTLAEEGVVLPPTLYDREVLHRLLTEAPFPTRAPGDNLADLEAAVAANRRGTATLIEMARTHGAETLFHYQEALARQSERLVREALSALPPGRRAAEEILDDGYRVAVAFEIKPDGAAVIDFTGTSPTHPGNLNAPPAVTVACVLYALRLLINEPIPLNEGMLRAVTLRLPSETLVNPLFHTDLARCPAVVGGNTEVSQKIANALVRALGLAAGSQGTMNNVLFGNDTFGYYETVCGGVGATATASGASAVHSHMTNTRITDVELLEYRYPVRLERFAVRRGSGGGGYCAGGDGVIREYWFLRPVALSLMTQGRTRGGQGAQGGESGKPGRQRIVRRTGETVELGSVAGCDVSPGDHLILETPGGGGWGKTPEGG